MQVKKIGQQLNTIGNLKDKKNGKALTVTECNMYGKTFTSLHTCKEAIIKENVQNCDEVTRKHPLWRNTVQLVLSRNKTVVRTIYDMKRAWK